MGSFCLLVLSSSQLGSTLLRVLGEPLGRILGKNATPSWRPSLRVFSRALVLSEPREVLAFQALAFKNSDACDF
jgi:hypothetical protein